MGSVGPLGRILAAAAALLVRGAPTDVPGLEVATSEDIVDATLDLAFPLVGALILVREPRNLFGWAFALVGLCLEASLFAASYARTRCSRIRARCLQRS